MNMDMIEYKKYVRIDNSNTISDYNFIILIHLLLGGG